MSSAPAAHAQAARIVLTDGLMGAGLGAAFVTGQALLSGGNRERAANRIPAAAAIGAVLGMALGSLEVAGAFAPRAAGGGRLVLIPPRIGLDPTQGSAWVWFEARF